MQLRCESLIKRNGFLRWWKEGNRITGNTQWARIVTTVSNRSLNIDL
jgi:hypothetical protein